VLINNAGAMFGARGITQDGLERTFALNHMAYFVVTEGLRERLYAFAGADCPSRAPNALGPEMILRNREIIPRPCFVSFASQRGDNRLLRPPPRLDA
jgi:NAD(P)-dependent dehydrogenase (short-subunit alcohol dehydrogenase family)